MLGWKANSGVVKGHEGQNYRPSNISEIEFLDVDKYMIVPQISNINSVSDGEFSTELPVGSYTEIANMIEGFFGSDYYYLYCQFYAGARWGQNYRDIQRNVIPSLFLMFENYNNKMIEYYNSSGGHSGSAYYHGCIYFPTIKKIILDYGNNIPDGGEVDENGNIIWSKAQTPALALFFSRRGGGFEFYAPSLLGNDFKDTSKYVIFYETTIHSLGYYNIGRTATNSYHNSAIDWLFTGVDKPDVVHIGPDNPYEPGGPSGPTDPDLPPGTFDDTSDPIPDSPLPTISAADTGFTRIYNPTLSQVKDLAQYLWTTPDVIATIWNHIKQFFENPMDAIIGFNLVPVHVPDGGTTNFKLMYIDTGVAMTAAANQFVDVDCGTLEVKRYYGSALDQSPYTKVSCFLPYIGTVQLNTDEVMGATLQVKYRVDICSGSCVAKIFIDGNCIYQYSGHCAINIPISSADFSSYVSATINVAKLAIGAATAGAGGAAMAAGQVAGTEQQTGNMAALQTQGGSSPAIYQSQSTQQSPSQTTTSASFAGLSPANISNTVGEIMNAKPHVEHSGSFSGNTGYLGVRRPFIIIERPNMCMPETYQALNGFPAMITMELSTCNGFTRVQQVQLTGMTATNPEQAEILELLKSGVIL